MIEETISRLEARLRESSCDPANREELLTLLRQLKGELTRLEETHSAEAEAIIKRAQKSAETAAEGKNPELLKGSLQELAKSVERFEESHPQLVDLVNRIATTLASLGI